MLLGIFSTIGIILIPAETYTFTDQKKKFLKTDNEIDDAPITNYIIIGIMIIVGIGIVIATLIGLFNRANLNDISEKPSTIKILTYNIHFGYDKNGNKAYYQLLDELLNSKADIIGLQETDTARISNGNEDIIRFLSDKMNYYSYYGPSPSMIFFIMFNIN